MPKKGDFFSVGSTFGTEPLIHANVGFGSVAKALACRYMAKEQESTPPFSRGAVERTESTAQSPQLVTEPEWENKDVSACSPREPGKQQKLLLAPSRR